MRLRVCACVVGIPLKTQRLGFCARRSLRGGDHVRVFGFGLSACQFRLLLRSLRADMCGNGRSCGTCGTAISGAPKTEHTHTHTTLDLSTVYCGRFWLGRVRQPRMSTLTHTHTHSAARSRSLRSTRVCFCFCVRACACAMC